MLSDPAPSSRGSSQGPTGEYAERLGVPLRWWVQGTLLVASFWLALIVAVPEPIAWAIAAAVMTGLALGLASYGSATITVRNGMLHAGRARIEIRHLGPVRALDEEETRRTAGMQADARAYLLLRPYLKRAVLVQIDDPADPVPYWLLCTRRPEELVTAVRGMPGAGGRGPG